MHRTSRTSYYNRTLLKKLSNDAQSVALMKIQTEYSQDNGFLSFREQGISSHGKNQNIQFVKAVEIRKKTTLADGTNLLGFVVFILVLTSALSSSAAGNTTTIKMVLELDAAFQKITYLVLCYSPIGLGFIACGSIMQMKDFGDTMAVLTKFLLCLSLGFFLHLILIFFLYAVTTRKNPIHVFSSVAEACLVALTAASRLVYEI